MKIQNIALDNKYTRWYLSIVKNRQLRSSTKKEAKQLLGYVEGHHIIPNSIYKNKDVVYLTAREHFICHWLLTKMFSNLKYKQKMHFALASFLRKTSKQNRLFNSKQYDIARKSIIIAMTNREVSLETKEKQSRNRKGRPAHNKGKFGKKTGPCTETRRLNISKSRKNTSKIKCDHCLKKTDPGNFKRFHGDNCKLNPNINPDILIDRSNKAKINIQKSINLGTFSKPKPLHGNFICPHCNKIGSNYGSMMKNHFNRCKSQEFIDIHFHS